ncbi:type II toxin-antitoxin system VapC family toxin [Rugamonas apoptosis]|nr:type II toxin-antitoxin system VapC family toxin [Rugamonas apoptosis]
MILVLDASMALAWMFERADAVQRDCADRAVLALTSVAGLVPPLWHVEVANALLVGERRRVITPAQSQQFLSRLDQLPITVDSALPGSRRDAVMGIARQYGLSAYDACYLDLAVRTMATLATFDNKLADAARNAGVALFE